MPDPVLIDDEGGDTVYLYNFDPSARLDDVAAEMVRIAAADWGMAITVDDPVRLLWLRQDPDDEESMIGCAPDHPDAEAAWVAEWREDLGVPPDESPGPTYGEIHPQQITIAECDSPGSPSAIRPESWPFGGPSSEGGLPDPAPTIVMAASGTYWRRYDDGMLSMVPTTADNDPVITPLAVYQCVGWEDHNGDFHAHDCFTGLKPATAAALRLEAAVYSAIEKGVPRDRIARFVAQAIDAPMEAGDA